MTSFTYLKLYNHVVYVVNIHVYLQSQQKQVIWIFTKYITKILEGNSNSVTSTFIFIHELHK